MGLKKRTKAFDPGGRWRVPGRITGLILIVALGAAGALIGLVIPPVRAVGGRDLAPWQKGALIGVLAVGAVALLLAVINFGQFLTSNPAVIPGS